MTAQRPAAELAAAASKPYPNDSAEYPRARTALLAEEVELRPHIERVAAQRRALPLGGEASDYAFKDETGRTVRLADLFGRHDVLVTYFWMYGPRPCPICTSFLGAIDVPSKDIGQRVAIAAIGRSPVERQLAFARERGWKHLEFYATVSTSGSSATARCSTSGAPSSAARVTPTRISAARPIRRRSGHPRPHARRARHRLVSEAGLRHRRLSVIAAKTTHGRRLPERGARRATGARGRDTPAPAVFHRPLRRTVGARGLSMHLVVIPPGAGAEPHSHLGHETGIYVLEGRVETRYGERLESSVVSEAGDFLFIPPGVPHEAINLSTSEAARAVVARNDPAEQDNVVPYDRPR